MLNRRSKTLSSYAGDTALPGGKIDDDDKTIEDTVVRPDTMSFSCEEEVLFLRCIALLFVLTSHRSVFRRTRTNCPSSASSTCF